MQDRLEPLGVARPAIDAGLIAHYLRALGTPTRM
jgi:hypothetical protein